MTDPYFDLSFHLRRISAPAPGTFPAVLEWARTSAMAGLDRERPLWQATLVEGVDGDRAALVLKAHHSLTDGVGGMQLALLLFDQDPAGDQHDWPDAPEPERLTSLDLWKEAARHQAGKAAELGVRAARGAVPTAMGWARDPIATTKAWAETAASVGRNVRPISETKSTVMRERGFSWRYGAFDVPFPALRSAAKATGTTVNDAFLAGITGGMRRYHERAGAPVDELRVGMPISIRKPDDPVGGNRVAIIRYSVPVGVADPAERLGLLHTAAKAARDEKSVPHSEAIVEAISPITPIAVGPMAFHVDFGASNVPGFPFPVYLAGAEALRYYPFGPTGGSSVNVTLLSYRDTCCIGVNSDTAAITDADAFHACLADGFDEVLALSGAGVRTVLGGLPVTAPEERPTGSLP
jgi:diacylglycerol O-acyltransferase